MALHAHASVGVWPCRDSEPRLQPGADWQGGYWQAAFRAPAGGVAATSWISVSILFSKVEITINWKEEGLGVGGLEGG